jgi:hypothetical protein
MSKLRSTYDFHFDLRKRCVRWTPQRKVTLVDAIGRRHISLDDAMSIHGVSREELIAWSTALRGAGSVADLRVTTWNKRVAASQNNAAAPA